MNRLEALSGLQTAELAEARAATAAAERSHAEAIAPCRCPDARRFGYALGDSWAEMVTACGPFD